MSKAQIRPSGPKFHSYKELSKWPSNRGLERCDQNEMKLLLSEIFWMKLPDHLDKSFGPNRFLL